MFDIILRESQNYSVLTLEEEKCLLNVIPYELSQEEVGDFCEAVESLKDSITSTELNQNLKIGDVISKVGFFVSKGIPFEMVVDFMTSKEATSIFCEENEFDAYLAYKELEGAEGHLSTGEDPIDSKYDSEIALCNYTKRNSKKTA